MPIAAYGIPQNGSFVAEPQQYGGYNKGGASYVATPGYSSYQPTGYASEYSMYGSTAPHGQTYASPQGPYHAQSYQQYSMPPNASYQYEPPTQQTYQMPATASFTYEPPTQSYSYQQQYAAPQSSYALPQQASFTAYPQPGNYSNMDMPRFQFYASGTPGVDMPSRPTGTMNHAPAESGNAPTAPMNHLPTGPEKAKPAAPMNHAPARPDPSESRFPKPNSSTSKRPPAKKPSKKKLGCCSCN